MNQAHRLNRNIRKPLTRNAKIHIQILLLSALLLAGFAVAMCSAHYVTARFAAHQLTEAMEGRRQSLRANLETQCRGLVTCAETLRDKEGSIEELIHTTPDLYFKTSIAVKVALTDRDGFGVNTQGEKADISKADFLHGVLNGESRSIGVGVSPEDGQSVFVITAPVYSGGQIRYVLAAAFAISDINEYLVTGIDADGHAYTLVDSRGRSVLSATAEDVPKAISNQSPSNSRTVQTLRGALKNGEDGFVTYVNHGESWYCAYTDLGINDWRLVYRVQEMETGYLGRRVEIYMLGLLLLSMGVLFWTAFNMLSREKKLVSQIQLEEQSLRASRECLKLLCDFPGAILCDTDLRTGKTFLYGGFESTFGRDPILANFPMDAARGGMIGEEDARKVRDVMEQAKHGLERAQVDANVRMGDGGYKRCRYLMQTISDENGTPFRVIGRIIELSELTDNADAADEIDPSTKLYSRRAAQERMGEAIGTGPCCLLLLDIDDSTRIEEELGREGMEGVFAAVADALRAISGPGDIIARLGGDEFALLSRGDADDGVLRDRTTRLLAKLESEGEARGIALSGSVGCAVSPRDGASFDELYFKADTAQYIAKQSGKRRFLIFKES